MTNAASSMLGKTCLVTGATHGLGKAAATELARMGASVVIVGRNRARIDNALAVIRQESGNPRVEGLQADLSSMQEIRRLAETFLSRHDSLDVLLNNVGATLLRYQASPDGYEMTWALNYLGHFLLTYLMTGALKTAAAGRGEARIVEVTSSMYRLSRPNFKQLQKERGYNGVLAYAHSKRAMIMYAVELTRRLQDTGVTINAVTPGAVRTGIAGDNGFLAGLMMRVIDYYGLPVAKGVQPILHLATGPELGGVSGRYFKKFKPMPDDPSCHQADEINYLWQLSETMACLS